MTCTYFYYLLSLLFRVLFYIIILLFCFILFHLIKQESNFTNKIVSGKLKAVIKRIYNKKVTELMPTK